MKALRPLLLSSALLLLSACSSEVEKAMEQVRHHPEPDNCLAALLCVYHSIESEQDSAAAQEQVDEIRQSIESFSALEMGEWLILLEERAEELEKAQQRLRDADWTVPQLYTEKKAPTS